MPFGSVGSDSFEFYEGVRIVIPGAVLAGLGKLLLWTVDPSESLSADFGMVLIAAVGLGLVAYFVDIPRQSAVYNRGLPSETFEKKFKDALETSSVNPRNAFFVVSDEVYPSAIRARALYSGSMFRIGFEAVLLIGLVQFAPWLIAIRTPGDGIRPQPDYFWWLVALACLPFVWLVAAYTNTRRAELFPPKGPDEGATARARVDDSASGEPTDAANDSQAPRWQRALQVAMVAPKLLARDMNLIDLLVLTASAALVTLGVIVGQSTTAQTLITFGISGLAGLWVVRFVYGGGTFSRSKRAPFDRLTVTFLFLVAALPAAVLARYRGGHAFLADPARVAAWLGAAALTALLIAARGHDKRLIGGYSTQKAWFELHEKDVIKALTESAAAPDQSDSP
jgi:hypothetical protein